MWKEIFVEMLGFFGARFLGSSAINGYNSKDLMIFYSPELDRFDFTPRHFCQDNFSQESFLSDFVYQQGYGLGDILFFNFINGGISRREVSKMFDDDLRGSSNAREKILGLRSRFWPIVH